MADTTIATDAAHAKQVWAKEALQEYLSQNVLKQFIGKDKNAMIMLKEDLKKEKGESVNVPLLAALDGAGVEGGGALEGNEEQMQIYNQKVTLTEWANAVKDDGPLTRKRASFDLYRMFKPELSRWMGEKFEKKARDAWTDVAGVVYGSASEVQKDADLVLNTDRFLFGAATANHTANDHSAALANIDSTTDVCTPGQLKLLKRLAKKADPKIRPVKVKNSGEYFVYLCDSYAARDLTAHDDWKNAHKDALPRGKENPIFTGIWGSIQVLGIYDGVMVVEWDKIQRVASVGAASITVACNLFCGAQSLVYPVGGYDEKEVIKYAEKQFEYDREKGVAIMQMCNLAKGYFNSKNHGLIKHWVASVAD